MQTGFPFQPIQTSTGNISLEAAVTATATVMTIPNMANLPTDSSGQALTLRVNIAGNQPVYIASGNVAAAMLGTTGLKLLANSVEVFTIPQGVTQITHNAPAAGSNISLSIGRGI